MRTIFIGDVHGCFDELMDILDKCSFNESQDRLIFVGDIINKGPKSKEVISYVMEKKFECVVGNHEIGLLKGKTGKLIQELSSSFSENEYALFIDWLKDLPYFIEEKDFIVVHGGIVPHCELQDSDPYMVATIRTWDGVGKNLKNPLNPAWYELYEGSKLVVFGHWAEKGLVRGSNYIGLDSGCVYGRKLSAYILEEDKVVQVDAKKKYSD